MWWTLMWKEFRECALYAGIALLFEVHYLGAAMQLPLIPMMSQGQGSGIPFLTNLESTFLMIATIAGIVLGLHQTAWESWRQTTLFLLHRPMPRTQIFLAKLATGILLVLGITVFPLTAYCLWAATPGTHASPFFWSFTEPYWRCIGLAIVSYLGAFLTGIRPARWIGSRSWPLITAIIFSQLLSETKMWLLLIYCSIFALMICLTISILDAAQRREYP